MFVRKLDGSAFVSTAQVPEGLWVARVVCEGLGMRSNKSNVMTRRGTNMTEGSMWRFLLPFCCPRQAIHVSGEHPYPRWLSGGALSVAQRDTHLGRSTCPVAFISPKSSTTPHHVLARRSTTPHLALALRPPPDGHPRVRHLAMTWSHAAQLGVWSKAWAARAREDPTLTGHPRGRPTPCPRPMQRVAL